MAASTAAATQFKVAALGGLVSRQEQCAARVALAPLSVKTLTATVQAQPVERAQAVVARAQASSADVAKKQSDAASTTATTYHFIVANAKFMLDEEEHFQEQLKERLRWLHEQGHPQDFWLVYEPEFLASFPEIKKRVNGPAVALVTTDALWMTFMKLRLDRVLRGEFECDSQEEALKSLPIENNFGKPAKWDAPYPKYESSWWTPYAAPSVSGRS
ncbi:hypothetical protein CLOM_g17877 [Closterium sp. NIES-68]|nr:hypothetical protein CLOM_g17877 [Closterium sp. NIES-68]GJP74011.1 hypothetical protein CLOP_g4664 [Closterium sp. NIES-67]